MEIYLNRGRDSHVIGYEIGADYITVFYRDGSAYRYTRQSTGAVNLQEMKNLAREGRGLDAYIMFNARNAFAAKVR